MEQVVPIAAEIIRPYQPLIDEFRAILSASLSKVFVLSRSKSGDPISRQEVDVASTLVIEEVAYDPVAGTIRPLVQVPLAHDNPRPNYPLFIEFASRYIGERSRRWRPESGSLEQHPKAPSTTLMERWPEQLKCEISIGGGWLDLVTAFLVWTNERGDKPMFHQIKEKFGELRLYHSGSEFSSELESVAENLSAFVCEDCGAPGRIRDGGWIRTLCDADAG